MSSPQPLALPPSPPASYTTEPSASSEDSENSRSQVISGSLTLRKPASELVHKGQSGQVDYSSSQYSKHTPFAPNVATQSHFGIPASDSSTASQHWTPQSDGLLSTSSEPAHPILQTVANMSAVAIPFDPTFAMGPRSAFTWPGHLESSPATTPMLPHDQFSMSHGSEASLTPPSTTRSLTSSPPRVSLTPQQRELKRQQDRVRRDSRLTQRIRRTNSNNSFVDSPPPMSMSDVTSAMSMSSYTTAPAPISLLTEPATSMATPPYIPSYSPSLSEQHQGSQVFQTAYQPMQPGYSMPMEYPGIYAGPGDYSARPSPIPVGQETGMMYQVPAVMTSGGAVAQEAGHVRVVQSRPKPRCWEHGCNGRQFSTFSNLLRHQREKSGQAAKATCPNCGAEFTRTTARNGHLLHDKCKQRRSSNN